ncbi:MAG TPA: MFS transporter, partial [Planctomycetota bacterium]|nr:MFS transporter [Planctomycetota bacterium]
GAAGLGAIARDSLAAVRIVLGIPRLRRLLLFFWLPPAFAVAPEALAVPYAADLGHPGSGAGLLLAAGPVGLVAGEILAVRLLTQETRIRLIVPLGLVAFVPLLFFAAGPELGIAIALLAAAGMSHASSLGLDQLLLEAIPEDLRGRAFSVATAGIMLTQGLGFAVAGALGQALGLDLAITLAGAGGLVAVAVLGPRIARGARPAAESAAG